MTSSVILLTIAYLRCHQSGTFVARGGAFYADRILMRKTDDLPVHFLKATALVITRDDADVVAFFRKRRMETAKPDTSGNVAFGSFSTELGCLRHVRSSPDSDRMADIAGGPVRANNEHPYFIAFRITFST
jgi:hypothetical protein